MSIRVLDLDRKSGRQEPSSGLCDVDARRSDISVIYLSRIVAVPLFI